MNKRTLNIKILNIGTFYKLCFGFLILFSFPNLSYSQVLLNGDFELVKMGIGKDSMNLTNMQFNSLIKNVYSFGTKNGIVDLKNGGNPDIISSGKYGPKARSGNFYLALTGGGTDMIALKTSLPLVKGTKYTLGYYMKKSSYLTAKSVIIGVSNDSTKFGQIVPTNIKDTACVNKWKYVSFDFIAPQNGSFITVEQTGDITAWIHLDKFVLNCEKPFQFSLGQDLILCPNQSAVIKCPIDDANYKWNTGDTTQSINVSKSGTYSVEAHFENCLAYDTVNISYFTLPLAFHPKITKLDCSGENYYLSSDSVPNALQYWVFDDQIINSNSVKLNYSFLNKYNKVVLKTLLCENTILDTLRFDINQFQTNISFENNLPERFEYGSFEEMEIKMKISGQSVVVDSIVSVNNYLLLNKSEIDNVNPNLSKFYFNFNGETKKLGSITDTLYFYINKPCKLVYQIPINTYIFANGKLWVEDFRIDVGEKIESYPVFLQIQNDKLTLNNLAVKAKLTCNSDYILPENDTKYSYLGDKINLPIDKLVNASAYQKVNIANFSFRIMLADTSVYNISLENIVAIEGLNLSKEDGKIFLEGCTINERLVKFVTPTKLSIIKDPNNSIPSVKITSEEKGSFVLSIFDVNSNLIQCTSFCNSDSIEFNHLIELAPGVISGAYYIRLNTPNQILTSKLLLVK